MDPRGCQLAAEEAKLNFNDLEYLSIVSREASKTGAEVLMRNYGEINTLKSKSVESDIVTNADIETEQIVIELLKKKTPELSILAEESGTTGDKDSLVWCIDPLDGTTNYAHKYPFFATSIGLMWNHKPILGSISAPALHEDYWGCPGLGSFCNDEPIKASKTKRLINSLLVTGFAYDRTNVKDNNYAEFCWMTHRTRGVRRAGAASIDLAYAACGRVDGYWERGLSPWDLAAGVAIAEIAGCDICDYKGGNFDLKSGRILACNPQLRSIIIDELQRVKPLSENSYGASEINSI